MGRARTEAELPPRAKGFPRVGGSRRSVWSRSQGAGGTRREPESWKVTTGRVGAGRDPSRGWKAPGKTGFPDSLLLTADHSKDISRKRILRT